MQNYEIGKVIGVFGDRIEVSLIDFVESDDDCIGVPDNMCINLNTDYGPLPLIIGQPGSFIQISIIDGILLAMVSNIKMRERLALAREIKEAESDDEYTIEKPERLISAIPIGTINQGGNFERGTDILPTVNSKVFAVSNDIIENIYNSFAEGDFAIGKLSLNFDIEAKININNFLGRHAAIIGQTGTGKSWTVASFIQKLSDMPRSTTILFDIHGEYRKAFNEEKCDYISIQDLEFPYWLMNFQELQDLMIDMSEYSAPNQIAKFRELLQHSKESHEENKSLEIPKITVDTPVYFDFDYIINEYQRLDVERVPGSRGDKQGPFFGQFTRLIIRLKSRLNDKRFDLIFKPKLYNNSASLEDLFRRLLGESDEKKNIIIIDISPIPIEVRSPIISLVLRCLFDFCYWYKRRNATSFPIAIFCDEAHTYLNEYDKSYKASRLSAEKIAKEGRKYGISLNVVTQRPREVSSTILSQCNSFMCMRIMNPDDQAYVKRLLPDSIKAIINLFSTLRRGECILLGDSVIMPTRIKLDKPDPVPTSDDTSFSKIWNTAYEKTNIKDVLDSWRKQED